MIQLYTWSTPNGRKVSIMLEELGLPYSVHAINIGKDDQFTKEFIAINPNSKIPAIVDPEGPDGEPISMMESGAILVYLAEKTGKLMPASGRDRYVALHWLMFQMGGVGPMFGQLGFVYKFAGAEIDDPRPRERYVNEARRLLAVVDKALEGRDWIADEFSIADIALAPWLNALEFYGAREITGWHDLKNVPSYVERFFARPAADRGRNIPPRE